MSNNKQSSSIDWLISQLQKSKDWHRVLNEISQMSSAKIDIIEQAKAMHKDEMINFTTDWHHHGLLSLGVLVSTSVEEHYNKIFNQ